MQSSVACLAPNPVLASAEVSAHRPKRNTSISPVGTVGTLKARSTVARGSDAGEDRHRTSTHHSCRAPPSHDAVTGHVERAGQLEGHRVLDGPDGVVGMEELDERVIAGHQRDGHPA